MPNHCYNEIQIVSDKGLAPIRKLIVNENEDAGLIDFNLCVPQPEEVRNSPDMLGDQDRTKPNWYDWNCENWGTKWNAYECEIIEDCIGEYNDMLEIKFTTAWGVPDKWVKHLSESYSSMILMQICVAFIALKATRTQAHGMCLTMTGR